MNYTKFPRRLERTPHHPLTTGPELSSRSSSAGGRLRNILFRSCTSRTGLSVTHSANTLQHSPTPAFPRPLEVRGHMNSRVSLDVENQDAEASNLLDSRATLIPRLLDCFL